MDAKSSPFSEYFSLFGLARFSTAVKDAMAKSKLGRKELIWLHVHSTAYHKVRQDKNFNRAGTGRQELVQKSWRGAAYWIGHRACSDWFLIEPGPPFINHLKKMLYGPAYSLIL